jgi:DNA-binding winged helix-turn-helix (wHTH) protein
MSFGRYRLDPASGRLLRDGKNVPLRRKTFAVLEYLAGRPGRLVGKDELLDAVWPDTHVTPAVLTGCIREIRRALGDDARAARFVETAHRRGYRFVASAVTSAAPDDDAGWILPPRRPGELSALARRIAAAIAGVIEPRAARHARPPRQPTRDRRRARRTR